MKEYPKAIKKKLKELSILAWKRELNGELTSLAERFNDWKDGKIDCFELNEYIHKFHNGSSKDIWKKYDYSQSDILVASAIAFGILKNDEITKEILDIIDERVKFIQQINEEE